MTFAQARENHLAWLDETYKKIRELVTDPDFLNDNAREYKDELMNFNSRLKKIIELNNAEAEAKE